MFEWIYAIVTFGSSLWYMEHVKKKSRADKESGLEGNERFIVPLLSFLNPIFAGIAFYYGWRKAFPKKAQSANHWSLSAFAIWLLIVVVLQGS